MTTDDEKTLSTTTRKTTTTATTSSSIPRADSYQQMKRAMESFNIEESMVRLLFSRTTHDKWFWNSLVFSSLDARCDEKRASRTPQIPSGEWRCVYDIDRSLALHFRPSLTTRSSRERDDDATQGCVLIECSNAFFQKREVFERTRVLTFFHLFLSLSFSLAMYSTRPHRHSTTRQRKTMWKQSSL